MISNQVAARSVHGSLNLRFIRDRDRTSLADITRTPPWGLQRLLYLDPARPALARATLLNATAGLFADDQLSLAVTVASRAQIELTTPTQTRAYAMPLGAATTTTTLAVDDGAYLCFLPEPTLLCRDAALTQHTTLSASAGAWAAAGEVFTFGRAGHGEMHAFRSLAQSFEAWRGGRLVLADALTLNPAAGAQSLGLIGDHAAYGALVCLCPSGHAPRLLDQLRATLPAPGGVAGASLLMDEAGVTLRVLAPSAFVAQQVLHRAAGVFRLMAMPYVDSRG